MNSNQLAPGGRVLRDFDHPLPSLREQINSLFDVDYNWHSTPACDEDFAPLVSQEDNAEAFVVKVQVSGEKPSDLDLEIRDDLLVLALRKPDQPRLERCISLPADVDGDAARATAEHGLLVITVPKRKESLAHKIPIE